jgi:hypothetical protein
LPQSPRGFASSSFSLLSVDDTQITHVTGVPSVFQHGWSARQAGRDQPPQGGRTLQDQTIPFLKGNRTIPFLFWRATANKVEEFPGRIVPRRRVSVRPRFPCRRDLGDLSGVHLWHLATDDHPRTAFDAYYTASFGHRTGTDAAQNGYADERT